MSNEHTREPETTVDHGFNTTTTEPSTEYPNALPKDKPPSSGRGLWWALMAIALVLAAIVVYGVHARHAADKTLIADNKEAAISEVKTTYPTGGHGASALTLPGSTQAYVDTPIYSRTSGYLQHWYFDMGSHVRKGQLMATIETPELDQQLQVAQADLKAAQANLDLANITSTRYQNLLTSNSVSKQETDVAMGNAASKQAAVEASMAGVRRLEQLQSFERVYAPFDGVVTARNTDLGALITGGTTGGGAAKELFHLASVDRLRVFVSVPEIYSAAMRSGGVATLTLDEFPGREFQGVIARNAGSIDPASRTLNVEVDLQNADGTVLPGAYVTVHFNVSAAASNLTIPANTLLFRAEGLRVGVVRNGHVELVPVKISADHGATVEIASGLTAEDAVVLDPSDSLTTGQQVTVAKKSGGGNGVTK